MALGTLSSLGFASQVLKQDILDKMKAKDEASQINPYKARVESNTAKQKDVAELLTKLSSFRTAVSSLGDSTAFAKRKVVSNVSTNPPADLTANSGVNLQSMKFDITQLAQKDVYQSKGLENENGYVNGSLSTNNQATLTFFQNGKEYNVNVDGNTTYRELAEKITQASGGNIVAKIVNTGEKNTPYRLTLSSKETGEDNAITFYAGKKQASTTGSSNNSYVEDSNAKTIFTNLGWDFDTTSASTTDLDNKKGYTLKDTDVNNPVRMQTAKNAEFTMDGIKMTRSSNTITDIGVGITLTLNTTGKINFDIQQDNSAINQTMQDLVEAYNNLVINLNAATDYNTETGKKGTLQGVSEVTSIRSTIVDALFRSQVVDGEVEDKNGKKVKAKVMLSMQDFGLTLNKNGNLAFDQSKFEKKIKENPGLAESFFAGITKYEKFDHTSELIKDNSLSNYVSSAGSSPSKELSFKQGDFVIVFGKQTYDLARKKDGTSFKLTGKTESELLENLVKHISSLGIEGLDVKLERYEKNNEKGYKIKFTSDSGDDFTIKGNKEFLENFGLSETTIIAKPIEGMGIFAKLKTTIDGITSNGVKGKNKGSLIRYDEGLTKDTKDLNEAKDTAQKLIDKRYEVLQQQWLMYESILNKLNSQLQALKHMIDASNNSKS